MTSPAPLPYKLACLCDLRDRDGRILLLRRLREPNKGLCSPIGGKLDMHTGESPAQCAQREIMEEAGIHVPIERLHLLGLISERAYEGKGHWLLFYYRVLGPVEVTRTSLNEGTLEWFHERELEALPLPQSDRQIIWPTVRRCEKRYDQARPVSHTNRPGFFALHIDCGEQGDMTWAVQQLEE
ncbi:MAG TPA: NUDIX hydrolase [Phycisphaerales bacterium]|nr:NUDIX hydrolase [Phycisphaerales bacterium]